MHLSCSTLSSLRTYSIPRVPSSRACVRATSGGHSNPGFSPCGLPSLGEPASDIASRSVSFPAKLRMRIIRALNVPRSHTGGGRLFCEFSVDDNSVDIRERTRSVVGIASALSSSPQISAPELSEDGASHMHGQTLDRYRRRALR